MKKMISPSEQGQQIISILSIKEKLRPRIYRNEWLTAEDGSRAQWQYFVKFPPELAAVFPGSYISPTTFFREFGINEDNSENQKDLLGNRLGTIDNPIMRLEQLGKKESVKFSLTVLNGLTNEHALAMTKFAFHGFNDSTNRAQYQHHTLESIKPLIEDPSAINYGVRIFDDCIASGDSIAGYLYKLYQKKNPLLAQGVEVTAVTATAQSILFLKSFAKMLGINLTIKVGQLAFGLTKGEEKGDDVREHANYITYPNELLPLLDDQVVQELIRFQIKIGDEQVIQVVGDMGEAEKGMLVDDMDQIRKELEDQNFCWWNDTREDAHGSHPNKNKLTLPPSSKDGKPVIIYLARGGYLPYEWDKKLYPQFAKVNKVIKRASRLWTKEHGYGVGIKNDN